MKANVRPAGMIRARLRGPDARSGAIKFGRTLVLAAILFVGALAGGEVHARSLKLVALGDSLTAGYGLRRSKSFPVQLGRALEDRGLKVEVINAGVSGDTASAGLARLDWAVPKGTDAVILELGANDALRGIDPEVTHRALDRIVTRLAKRGIAILLAGFEAPRGLGDAYTRRFARIYTDIAKAHDVLFYPFFLKGIALRPKLNQRDGMHPNPAGVRVIVRNILPMVEKLLERSKLARSARNKGG